MEGNTPEKRSDYARLSLYRALDMLYSAVKLAKEVGLGLPRAEDLLDEFREDELCFKDLRKVEPLKGRRCDQGEKINELTESVNRIIECLKSEVRR
tara:strand:+ start:102 stop:389 length:288 start_codon:yes stop_codon:yes gene_type:complete